MKFFLYAFFFLLSLTVRAQIGYEDYYSEKDLKSRIQYAKTLLDQVDANGMLAQHYKGVHQDSLGDFYYKKISDIAAHSNDNNVVGRALWWDMRYHEDTAKAISLLQYAEQYKQIGNAVAANLFLSGYYIHTDLSLAEKYVLAAKKF